MPMPPTIPTLCTTTNIHTEFTSSFCDGKDHVHADLSSYLRRHERCIFQKPLHSLDHVVVHMIPTLVILFIAHYTPWSRRHRWTFGRTISSEIRIIGVDLFFASLLSCLHILLILD